MTRLGPNQDINDPTTLESLRNAAHNSSKSINNAIRASLGLPANENLAIPIYTILTFPDNSKTQIVGFTDSGGITEENRILYEKALIQTHIFQPELYRNFYQSLDVLTNGFVHPSYNQDLSLESSEDVIISSGSHIVSSGWNSPFITDGVFIQDQKTERHEVSGLLVTEGLGSEIPDPLPFPDWSGVGPTSYYPQTYPQLINTFNTLNTWGQSTTTAYSITETELKMSTNELSSYSRPRRTTTDFWFTVGQLGFDSSILTQRIIMTLSFTLNNLTDDDITITFGGTVSWGAAYDTSSDFFDEYGILITREHEIKIYAGIYDPSISGASSDLVLLLDQQDDFLSGSETSENIITLPPHTETPLVWMATFDVLASLRWQTILVREDIHPAYGFRRNVTLTIKAESDTETHAFTALTHVVEFGV